MTAFTLFFTKRLLKIALYDAFFLAHYQQLT